MEDINISDSGTVKWLYDTGAVDLLHLKNASDSALLQCVTREQITIDWAVYLFVSVLRDCRDMGLIDEQICEDAVAKLTSASPRGGEQQTAAESVLGIPRAKPDAGAFYAYPETHGRRFRGWFR